MRDHRRLQIWARSHAQAVAVRRATRRFPRSGYGKLQSQITNAAESVMLNIVEGCGASSPKDFARFLDHSIKSSSELESQLELAKDYGVLPNRQYQDLAAETVEIRRMICGYRSKLLITAKGGDKPSG
jgi:four helix bundle protein